VKKPVSAAAKLCEDLVYQDFWPTAWGICAERFLTKAAAVIVGLELRDTWLRIVEVSYVKICCINDFIQKLMLN